jgi:hypothetical protein
MKNTLILGISLLLIGAAILAYGHFSYRTNETVLEVGPITATAERTHTVPIPPILGWALLSGGVCVLVFSSRSKV